MVTLTRSAQRLTLPLPLAGAVAGGGLVALAFLVVPSGMLERAVSASGIPAVLAAAEPPLGITARIALGIAFGGLVAAFSWVGLQLLANERTIDTLRWPAWLKRGDVHPDAPPRPPLFATRDLGTPFLEVKAPETSSGPAPVPLERELPMDLDQPLASFDPAAMPAVPMPAPEAVKPLAVPILVRPQLIDPGDRFETFELTPVQRQPASTEAPRRPISLRVSPASSLRATTLRDDADAAPQQVPKPTPVVAPATESTVHALLARLERGVAQRDDVGPAAASIHAHTLQDTLGDLRRLATGAR